MSNTQNPAPINPWPLIHRIVYRAEAIAKKSALPHAAVIFNREIQIIPRHAIGVGCTVLWTWTVTDLRRGLTSQTLADLESRFVAAIARDLDDSPNITCPRHPELDSFDTSEPTP